MLIIQCSVKQQGIEVMIPSAEDEADYIWYNLQDISFFEEYGYDLVLPESKEMSRFVENARANALSAAEKETLKELMKNEIHDSKDYQLAFDKINSQKKLLNELIEIIDGQHWDWGFKRFENYNVNITLYGTGGSYDAERGTIMLFATKEGQFKQYKNPANTLIHEIIHIGIEESIIQKFNVPHAEKERIVDRIVWLLFADYLPEYRVQNMGDAKVDDYVKDMKSLKRLDESIRSFMMNAKN